jgi:hypothetical protein
LKTCGHWQDQPGIYQELTRSWEGHGLLHCPLDFLQALVVILPVLGFPALLCKPARKTAKEQASSYIVSHFQLGPSLLLRSTFSTSNNGPRGGDFLQSSRSVICCALSADKVPKKNIFVDLRVGLHCKGEGLRPLIFCTNTCKRT